MKPLHKTPVQSPGIGHRQTEPPTGTENSEQLGQSSGPLGPMLQHSSADKPCEGGVDKGQGLRGSLNQLLGGEGQTAKPLQAGLRPHPVTELLPQQVGAAADVENPVPSRVYSAAELEGALEGTGLHPVRLHRIGLLKSPFCPVILFELEKKGR